MNKILKIITIIIFAFAFAAFPNLKILALTVSPSTATVNPISSYSLNLIANFSQNNIYAIQVRISSVGADFIDFQPVAGTDWIVSKGDCAGSAFYTSTTLCFTMAKSTPITNGEVIGVMTLDFLTPGNVILSQTSGNGYSDGNSFYEDTSNVLTYTIQASDTEPDPGDEETPPDDDTDNTPDTPISGAISYPGNNNNGNNNSGNNVTSYPISMPVKNSGDKLGLFEAFASIFNPNLGGLAALTTRSSSIELTQRDYLIIEIIITLLLIALDVISLYKVIKVRNSLNNTIIKRV